MPHVIVWDLETVPDIAGYAAANGLAGKSDKEIREALGNKFPKHIYHSIVCIGALVAHKEADHWAVDAIGAPHVGERTEKQLISAFVNKIAELNPELVTFNGNTFDLPVLRYRAMIHAVSAPGLTDRPYFNRYTEDALDLCDVLSSFAPHTKASPPSRTNISRLLQESGDVRQKFGGEIVPILVGGTELWQSSPLTQELRDAGFFIVSLTSSAPAVSSARRCAKEIRDFLIQLPYQFKGIKKRSGTVMANAFPAPSSPLATQESSIERALDSIHRVRVKKDTTKPRQRSQTRMHAAPAPSPPLDAMLHLSGDVSLSKALKTVSSDIFTDVLTSLKSVLSPEQFQVLEHELAAFSEEYRHEHYTACALRIGRTLEHVVYALARSWGVNVNRTTLQVLSSLNTSFEQLSKTVITYATADGNAKSNRKKKVQEQFENVSNKLLRLVFDLDSHMHPESTDVPVNVESILRDIRKQFASRQKVFKTVDDILKEDLLRKILDMACTRFG